MDKIKFFVCMLVIQVKILGIPLIIFYPVEKMNVCTKLIVNSQDIFS